MTYLYLVLVLCTLTNAYRRSEDVGVEHVVVPNVHTHAVHEKYAPEVEDHPSARAPAPAPAEDVSGHHNGHATSKSAHEGEHSAVPQDVVQALQEISRRGFMMQRPPMPVPMHHQVPHVPQHPNFYGMSRSTHDVTSEMDHESRHGSDGAHHGGHHTEHERHHNPHHPGHHEGHHDGHHEGHHDGHHAGHHAGPHEVSRAGHGAVHDSYEDVRRPITVRVSEAHEEAARASEHHHAEEASRSSPHYMEEADHTANRSPIDMVNMINPVAYETQDDNRAGIYDMTGFGGMGGMGGMGDGLGGANPFGGMSGMGGLGGVYGMGGVNPFSGVGGIGGMPAVPGGMKIYNVPHMPTPPVTQFPGYYGR